MRARSGRKARVTARVAAAVGTAEPPPITTPPRERHRDERGGQQHRERAVDQRRVDQAIDLVEPVAHHRDPDRRPGSLVSAMMESHQRDQPVVAGEDDLQDTRRDGRGDQRRGVGQPPQLAALEAGGPPQPHPHRGDGAAEGGERAERGERLRDADDAVGQLRERAVGDVAERLAVRLGSRTACTRSGRRRTAPRRSPTAASEGRAAGRQGRPRRSRSRRRTAAAKSGRRAGSPSRRPAASPGGRARRTRRSRHRNPAPPPRRRSPATASR